ncbi:MAG: glycosyltransferase family 39 protein, partial [Candidatus Niyogibacteria bacterium]|nr:glycosyltransferase family 39 protein [Candidatus Niyogibacteria bacterium]
NFALRFPSAVLGILSVYLLYLIGRRLYSARAGLVAAALMAVTLNSVYISRTGLQEAFVIFFLLLASYFFLRSLDEENYLIWLGAALGLGFLTKYNVFVLVPIFTTYLLFFRRDYFLNKKLWLGGALAAIIFSPVIIYNIKLYQTVGHFDFQFSYIFGQNPEVWKIAPGKEIGGLTDRLKNFVPRLISTNSWLFLGIFAAAAFAALIAAIKKQKEFLKKHAFLLTAFIYLFLLLMAIGPSYRFLTMLTPFMALTAGVFFYNFYQFLQKGRRPAAMLFGAFLVFEIFYTANNQIAYYPAGNIPWTSSKVRFENYNWGNNALGDFFNEELKNKMPAIRFDARYKFIEKAQDKSLELAHKYRARTGISDPHYKHDADKR